MSLKLINSLVDELDTKNNQLHALVCELETKLNPSAFKDENDADLFAWRLCQVAVSVSEDNRTMYLLQDALKARQEAES